MDFTCKATLMLFKIHFRNLGCDFVVPTLTFLVSIRGVPSPVAPQCPSPGGAGAGGEEG